MPEERQRIADFIAVFMISVALMIDGMQGIFSMIAAIPFIGIILSIPLVWVLSFSATFMFYLWFRLQGVTFLERGGSKAIILFGGALIELIPIFNALPGWTLAVVATIVLVRRDDKLYNENVRKRRKEIATVLRAANDNEFEEMELAA